MVKLHQAFCISPSDNTFLGFLTSGKWQHFKVDLLTNLDMLILQKILSHSTETLHWNYSWSTDTLEDLFTEATTKDSLEESLKKATKLPRSTAVSPVAPEQFKCSPRFSAPCNTTQSGNGEAMGGRKAGQAAVSNAATPLYSTPSLITSSKETVGQQAYWCLPPSTYKVNIHHQKANRKFQMPLVLWTNPASHVM